MKSVLLPLLVLVAAGSFAKADTLNYKYTLHIDGVVLPGDGIKLPSIELAFLAADDVRFGKDAMYFYGLVYPTNAVKLYLRESVNPSSPFYINPFVDFSFFWVGVKDIGLDQDQFYKGDNIAGYDTNFDARSTQKLLPGPGQTAIGLINGYSTTFQYPNGDYESAVTNYTLSLTIVPEPSAASLLALGLVGFIGLAIFRKKAHFAGNGDIGKNGV